MYIYIQEIMAGESSAMQFTVEISCKLGTITIPKRLRNKFKFAKGTYSATSEPGFRDSVVRFTGFIPDIRDALKNLKYHTKQDENVQYKNQHTGRCSRACFLADIGPATFENAKETSGCEQSCSALIYSRVNDFDATVYNEDESAVYLDAVVITFDDRAATGIGLVSFSKVLLYNIYSLAINDRPCSVFAGGLVTDGCRERCANPIRTSGCQIVYSDSFDPIGNAGDPFDILMDVTRDYEEDDVDAVKLGGMLVKPNDMYDASRLECRTLLSKELSGRGASTYVLPGWISDCPLLRVRISAIKGEISLNNRENLIFIQGGSSRYANIIEFIGHPVDCNVAMRMVLYKMSASATDYNSARGIEQVTFLVNDQGFSGADSSGEFVGSSQVSTTVVNINILPVNDPPAVKVPRPTDFIEFDEHSEPILQSVTLPVGSAGLDVQDVDSYECGACSRKQGTFAISEKEDCINTIDPATGLLSEWETGRITVEASVIYGRLSIVTKAEPGVIPLPDWAKIQIETYLDHKCSEVTCQQHKGKNGCDLQAGCDWNGKACWCMKVTPGSKCSTLKMRGPSEAIRAAIAVMRYTPETYFNKLTYTGPVETLTLTATDKRHPGEPLDPDFFCGDSSQLDESEWFSTGVISIQPKPINDPPQIGFFPVLANPSFEFPAICQGLLMCEFYNPFCVGVALQSVEGWSSSGEAGITYQGWTGDSDSASGSQHVFLHVPERSSDVPTVAQNVTGFTLGMEYTVSVKSNARNDKQMGSMLNISMAEDPLQTAPWLYSDEVSDAWTVGLIEDTTQPGNIGIDTWIQCRGWCELSVSVEQVNPGPSTSPFSPMPDITFVAHSQEYGISIYANRISSQIGDRMVFVDDVRIKVIRILCLEDIPFLMEGLQIVDPDVTLGSLAWVKTRPIDRFIFELKITAKHGTFDLIKDPLNCNIMPASDNFQIDYGAGSIMNDEERIRFGIRCGIGDWANRITFRTACPEKCLTCNPPVPFAWVGKGIPPNPCMRLPLESITIAKTEITGKLPGFDLEAATIIPMNTLTVTGEIEGIRKTFGQFIEYSANLNFNTENRGIETLTFTVNDKSNVEIPTAGAPPSEKITTTSIDVLVKAINDAPTLEFTIPQFSLLEDGTLPLKGIVIGDVDLNEKKCKNGVCEATRGTMSMKLTSQNGTFSINPEFAMVNLNGLINMDYGIETRSADLIYTEPGVYQCIWRVWCDDLTSPEGSPKLGLDFAAPCAHLPRHHTLQECVDYKLPFCQLVRAIVDENTRSFQACQVKLAETALNEKRFSMLEADEVENTKAFQKRVALGAVANPIGLITRDLLVLIGPLPKLQAALDASWIIYNPNKDFNGEDLITVMLNDLGNEGMQYPCPTPPDLPERLHLEHCAKTRPHVAQTTTSILPITVIAVNDKSYIVQFDQFGNEQVELLTVEAIQNITVFLPPMAVRDVDLFETRDAQVEIDLSVKSGALAYNFTKVSGVAAFLAPGGARLQAVGILADINFLLANIEYQSDPQMLGSDQVMIEIDDKGQTGLLKQGEFVGSAVFYLQIVITKPSVCEYATCTECIDQILEVCGWCPGKQVPPCVLHVAHSKSNA